MSAPAADKVEVQIAGKAVVPAKYADVINAMVSSSPEMFQEVADAWIKEMRLVAAKAGVEDEEVMAEIIAESQAKAAEK